MVERYLVKTAKVHLNQGASYGMGGENHMRMNIATSRKTLELALNNLANAHEEHHKLVDRVLTPTGRRRLPSACSPSVASCSFQFRTGPQCHFRQAGRFELATDNWKTDSFQFFL